MMEVARVGVIPVPEDKLQPTIGVFCGSRVDEGALSDCAYRFGAAAARARVGVVFGGGSRGLMGSLARGVKENDGRLIGVMAEDTLQHEPIFGASDELVVLPNNQQRRLAIIEKSDLIAGFPGGIGTIAEILEALFYKKCTGELVPIVLYNAENYYGGLFEMLDVAVAAGHAKKSDRHLLKGVNSEVEFFLQTIGALTA